MVKIIVRKTRMPRIWGWSDGGSTTLLVQVIQNRMDILLPQRLNLSSKELPHRRITKIMLILPFAIHIAFIWSSQGKVPHNCRKVPSFKPRRQKKIVVACMLLHNYIVETKLCDEEFDKCERIQELYATWGATSCTTTNRHGPVFT